MQTQWHKLEVLPRLVRPVPDILRMAHVWQQEDRRNPGADDCAVDTKAADHVPGLLPEKEIDFSLISFYLGLYVKEANFMSQ